MDPELTKYAALGLGVIGIFTVLYILVDTFFLKSAASKRQKKVVSGNSNRGASNERSQTEQLRRKEVQDVLKTIDEKKEASKKGLSAKDRLAHAGFSSDSLKMYYILSLASGVVVGVLALAFSGNSFVGLGGFIVGMFGVPKIVLNFMIAKRTKKFIAEFGNAIDIIVRGVKAGLPFNDCLRIIVEESNDPVRGEFALLLAEQKAGLSFEAALKKFYERTPIPEVNFFIIVLAIQMQVGGNVAEALSNLSDVLRDRRRLKGKIKAMSQEAKSSAAIIGALPILVGSAVSFIVPGYMDPLFKQTEGHFVIGGGIFLMLCGILVMRQMINFKI